MQTRTGLGVRHREPTCTSPGGEAREGPGRSGRRPHSGPPPSPGPHLVVWTQPRRQAGLTQASSHQNCPDLVDSGRLCLCWLEGRKGGPRALQGWLQQAEGPPHTAARASRREDALGAERVPVCRCTTGLCAEEVDDGCLLGLLSVRMGDRADMDTRNGTHVPV